MKGIWKCVILVCKKAEKGWLMHFIAVKKFEQRSGFVVYSASFKRRCIYSYKKGYKDLG